MKKIMLLALLLAIGTQSLFALDGLLKAKSSSKKTWIIKHTFVDEDATQYHRKITNNNSVFCYLKPSVWAYITEEDLQEKVNLLDEWDRNAVKNYSPQAFFKLAQQVVDEKKKLRDEINGLTARISTELHLQEFNLFELKLEQMTMPRPCITREDILKKYKRYEELQDHSLYLLAHSIFVSGLELGPSLKSYRAALNIIKQGLKDSISKDDKKLINRALKRVFGTEKIRKLFT